MLRPATPTIENCQLAEKNGADILVVTGFDSGGTAPASQIGTFSILPMIADKVNLPILAAGGIGDVRGVRAAMALGAEGVYLGTAFMAVEENPLARNVKELMIKTSAEDLHLVKGKSMLRSVPTEFTSSLLEMSKNGASEEEITQKLFSGRDENETYGLISGDYQKEYINAGLAVSFIKEIRPAKALIEDLAKGII